MAILAHSFLDILLAPKNQCGFAACPSELPGDMSRARGWSILTCPKPERTPAHYGLMWVTCLNGRRSRGFLRSIRWDLPFCPKQFPAVHPRALVSRVWSVFCPLSYGLTGRFVHWKICPLDVAFVVLLTKLSDSIKLSDFLTFGSQDSFTFLKITENDKELLSVGLHLLLFIIFKLRA